MTNYTDYRRIEFVKTKTLRIVIPQHAAKKLKLNSGDYLKITIEENKIVMEKADK